MRLLDLYINVDKACLFNASWSSHDFLPSTIITFCFWRLRGKTFCKNPWKIVYVNTHKIYNIAWNVTGILLCILHSIYRITHNIRLITVGLKRVNYSFIFINTSYTIDQKYNAYSLYSKCKQHKIKIIKEVILHVSLYTFPVITAIDRNKNVKYGENLRCVSGEISILIKCGNFLTILLFTSCAQLYHPLSR